MALKDLEKGDLIDIHAYLRVPELKIIDALCKKYDCARGAVIGALAREYEGLDLTGKVTTGRRPGGGRKKSPRKDPMAEFYAIVPELKKKI